VTAVQSPFANNGYGSNPVISGAAALNSVLVASSATAAAWAPGVVKLAATPAAGYTMVNGTGTIISWTAPNDGNNHRVHLFASLSVTVTEVGGAITCSFTAPDGTSTSHTVYAAAQVATDVIVQGSPFSMVIKANTTFTLTQNTALTSGASVLFAEIWGS